MSVDYYTRLEQSRDVNPSESILAGLARALRLSLDERDYLYRLAGYPPPAKPARDATEAERLGAYEAKWAEGGSISFLYSYTDLLLNKEANDTAAAKALWEGSGLFGSPVCWNWPKQGAMSRGLLGEGGPLRVAHDSTAARIASCEFAPRD